MKKSTQEITQLAKLAVVEHVNAHLLVGMQSISYKDVSVVQMVPIFNFYFYGLVTSCYEDTRYYTYLFDSNLNIGKLTVYATLDRKTFNYNN